MDKEVMDKEIRDFCRSHVAVMIILLATSIYLAIKYQYQYGFSASVFPTNTVCAIYFIWHLYSSRRVIYKSFPGIFKSKL